MIQIRRTHTGAAHYLVDMPTESWTAVIAAGSAILASLVTGLITYWSTKGADDRADARERARVDQDAAQRERELAEAVADAFRDELTKVRRNAGPDGPPFDELYFDAWWERIEMDLRQPVDRLRDDVLRRRLTTIIECVPDDLVWQRQWNERDTHVANLLSLGRDLAMAGVRGQQPDEHTVQAIDRYAEDLRIADEHRENQREAQRAARDADQ